VADLTVVQSHSSTVPATLLSLEPFFASSECSAPYIIYTLKRYTCTWYCTYCSAAVSRACTGTISTAPG